MKVFICSPYAGDIVRNIQAAQSYCRKAVAEGHFPLAPHLYFPQFLDDTDPEERTKGIGLGLFWLALCDEMWVFGTPSADMKTEILQAEKAGIPIRYFEEPSTGRDYPTTRRDDPTTGRDDPKKGCNV